VSALRAPFRSEGIALPVALLAILILSLVGAGIWGATDIAARSALNRQERIKAMQLAEAGVAHAVAVLRDELPNTPLTQFLIGDDDVLGTEDDGHLVGFGLGSGLEIPAAGLSLGGGTYSVRVVDDPADGDGNAGLDSNGLVILQCVGSTPSGGSATVQATLSNPSGVQLPAVVVDGVFTISGDPQILGTCGSVHANDDFEISGNPIVGVGVSSSTSVFVGGSVTDPAGDPITTQNGVDPIPVPDHSDPTQTHCHNADFILLTNGYIRVVADGNTYDARGTPRFGWKRAGEDPMKWDYSGDNIHEGVFCVEGNAFMSGSPGEPQGMEARISIIASGSIEISGNPLLTSADPDGVLLMAGGDVKIGGNPQGSLTNYTGSIYARSQCEVSGNPVLNSQIQCKDLGTQSGVMDLVSENKLNGSLINTYQCGTEVNEASSRRIVAWAQYFGS
jgi:hypothetical protein